MNREYTKEEVLEKFMTKLWGIVDYWNDLEDKKTTRERISGTVFSILAELDGCGGDIPPFIVAPLPHQDDKKYHTDNKENYFPENHLLEDEIKCDLGGSLHDSFHRFDPKKNISKDSDLELENKIISVLRMNLDLEISGRSVITSAKFKKIAQEIINK